MRAFIRRIAKRLLTENKPIIQKIYNSYQEAITDCEGSYDNKEISEIVLKKTQRFINGIKHLPFLISDTVTSSELIALLLLNKNNLSVIDIGGACGLHYFICKDILGEKMQFNWNVVETENMSVQGNSLANNELSFFSDLDKVRLDDIDLIISSGTIQYMPNPREVLLKITEINPEYILLTRLSLSVGDKDIITVQRSLLSENGPGSLPEGFEDKEVRYVHTNMSERDFNDIMLRKYKIILKFNEETGIHRVNNEDIAGYGFLFKKK